MDYLKLLQSHECIDSPFYRRIMRSRTYSNRNHDLLQFAINNDLDTLYSDFKLYKIRAFYFKDEEDLKMFRYLDFLIQEFNDSYDTNLCKLFDNFFRNQFRKLDRVRNKVYSIHMQDDDEYGAYFCTLTLEDTYDCESITREIYSDIRTKIRKFIADYSGYYVFNKDFGLNDTKRLHFHGVALLKRTQVDSFKYNYNRKFGFCKVDSVRNNPDFISQYINKLTKHALKVNYGYYRENFIYSRDKS